MSVTIRPLRPQDRSAWEPLWAGYLAFYEASLPAAATATAWDRIHDPAEPIEALGAFDGDRLLGIVHLVFHRSTWTPGDYCYLQDLFTVPEARGRGVGRALIEGVYARAKEMGASRVHWLTQEGNATARLLYDRVADRSGFIQYRKLF